MPELPVPNHFPRKDDDPVRHTSDQLLSTIAVSIQDRAIVPTFERGSGFERALILYLQRFYGKEAINIRESWRELSDSTSFPQDPIFVERTRIYANLVAIADVEAVSPGIASRLLEADGIRNPGRYSRLDLLMQDYTNQQIEAGGSIERRNTALLLVGVSDWKNAYDNLKYFGTAPGSKKSLERAQFGIHIIESTGPEESNRLISSYVARFGKQEQAILMIHAHGNTQCFRQGRLSDGVFHVDDFHEGNSGWHMIQQLATHVVVFLCTCKAAGAVELGQNIAEAVFDVPNVTDVFGPSKNAIVGAIRFGIGEDQSLFYIPQFGEGNDSATTTLTQGRRYRKEQPINE